MSREGARWQVTNTLSPEEFDQAYRWISEESYWAKGLPRNVFDRSAAHSLCFALRDDTGLTGFARVVSDRATFAYLCDVFICASVRGEGAGRFLIEAVMNHPDLRDLRRWLLATRDAHRFYEPFGFEPLPDPARIMVRNDPDLYARLAAGNP